MKSKNISSLADRIADDLKALPGGRALLTRDGLSKELGLERIHEKTTIKTLKKELDERGIDLHADADRDQWQVETRAVSALPKLL